MGDPRRRGAPGGDPFEAAMAGAATGAATGDDRWPHPWTALVERYANGRDEPDGAPEYRVAIVWWKTRAGRQPVLLVRRIRYD